MHKNTNNEIANNLITMIKAQLLKCFPSLFRLRKCSYTFHEREDFVLGNRRRHKYLTRATNTDVIFNAFLAHEENQNFHGIPESDNLS